MPDERILEIRQLSKQFPGVKALTGVDFTMRSGEIHALMGENGAGKSTLIKVLTGVYPRDGGEILLDGQPIRRDSAQTRRRAGSAPSTRRSTWSRTSRWRRTCSLGRQPTRGG